MPLDLQAVRAEKAKRHLLPFAQLVYPGFQIGRHHRAIAEALERVERGEIRRLIIDAPPRHGKSLLTSILFPAWYLGRNSDNRLIACSYSVDLSFDLSRKARNTITSPEYADIFPGVQLAGDARAVGQWELNAPHRGGYVSAGVGGGITGKGSHLLLIDDPVKNAEEAGSAAVLEGHWQWYTSTAYTRLEGEGAIVLIMTRWSEDDLAGRLIKAMGEGGDHWEILHLPALAEENDPLGRDIDEALWPEKYPADALQRIQGVIGSRDFAALYQQRPSPAGGAIFKREWWKRYGAFDRDIAQQVIQVWDTAFQKTQTADYSVCATWALAPTGAYLLDVFRGRLEFPDLKRKAQDQFTRWNPVAVLIEDKASGQSLIQELGRETRIPVIAVKVDSDKVTRAHAVTPYVEAGRAYLPESAPWADEFIEEHSAFPMGAHDDQCLIAGTLIETEHGPRPIETIRSGDRVWTSQGLHPVTSAGMTSPHAEVWEVKFSDGRALTATPNHPIFTREQGFVRLDTTCIGDTIEIWQPKSSSSTASRSVGIPSRKTWHIDDTSALASQMLGRVCRLCTRKSGSQFTDQFLKAAKSITLTGIGTTTSRAIWSVSLSKTIAKFMLISSARQGSGSICNAFSQRLLPGIAPKRGESGTVRTANGPGQPLSPRLIAAHIAGKTSSQSPRFGSTAQIPAIRRRNASDASSRNSVSNAAQLSSHEISGYASALVRVAGVRVLPRTQPVYNLSVSGAHEYYANGVRVHNCDTTSMALKRLFGDPRTFRSEDIDAAFTPDLEPDTELFA